MKNILITGGPVHAYLDAVKIITNRFKGGLIAQLATDILSYDARIHYVYPAGLETKKPDAHKSRDSPRISLLRQGCSRDGCQGN